MRQTLQRFRDAIAIPRRRNKAEIVAMLDRLPVGGTAIDIGADTGQYTRFMNKGVGAKGRVVAIEPRTDLAEMLKDLYRSNNRIRIRNSALITAGANPTGDHNYHGHEAEHPPISLSEIPLEYALRRIDFIRCALGGGENAFFENGFGVINKYKPAVLVELTDQPSDSSLPRQLWSIFHTLDYTGQYFASEGLADLAPLLEQTIPRSVTLLFTHPHKQNMLIR